MGAGGVFVGGSQSVVLGCCRPCKCSKEVAAGRPHLVEQVVVAAVFHVWACVDRVFQPCCARIPLWRPSFRSERCFDGFEYFLKTKSDLLLDPTFENEYCFL